MSADPYEGVAQDAKHEYLAKYIARQPVSNPSVSVL